MTDEKSPLERTSFAKTLSTLQKLTKMESAIAAAIDASRVPGKEVRKFLKCSSAEQASNTSLFQFMQNLFKSLELGTLEIKEIEHFKHTYTIPHSPVAKLYTGVQDKKTCYITVDTISQFFSKDLNIPCTVEETKCINSGEEVCHFEVNMQPLSIYQIVLDKVDHAIIASLAENRSEMEHLATATSLEDDEISYRLDILNSYYIIDENKSLTKIGNTYFKYGYGVLPDKDEDFSPPWETMTIITEAISSAESFAEAMSETTEGDPIFEIKKEDVVNLAEEAKKSLSFAELLSKTLKSTKKEESD